MTLPGFEAETKQFRSKKCVQSFLATWYRDKPKAQSYCLSIHNRYLISQNKLKHARLLHASITKPSTGTSFNVASYFISPLE